VYLLREFLSNNLSVLIEINLLDNIRLCHNLTDTVYYYYFYYYKNRVFVVIIVIKETNTFYHELLKRNKEFIFCVYTYLYM